MQDLLERAVDANRRKHSRWRESLGEDAADIDPVLYPGLSAPQLAELADAAGHELPDELVAFLSAPDVRLGVSLAHGVRLEADQAPGEQEETGGAYAFAWLDGPEMLRQTRDLRSAAEEYSWQVPACVVLSAESSEVIAYQLQTRTIVHVSAHDDGEVTSSSCDLAGLLRGYVAAVERELAD